jgi:hypothetical protein
MTSDLVLSQDFKEIRNIDLEDSKEQKDIFNEVIRLSHCKPSKSALGSAGKNHMTESKTMPAMFTLSNIEGLYNKHNRRDSQESLQLR